MNLSRHHIQLHKQLKQLSVVSVEQEFYFASFAFDKFDNTDMMCCCSPDPSLITAMLCKVGL